MHQEIFSALKKISYLANLPDETLNALAAKAKSAKFPKRATIITEGDETSSLYVILSGKVRVYSSDDKNSKEVTLLLQEAGTHFGELALLSDEPRSATVETLEKTVCGIISKADFLNWLSQNPDIAIALLGVLSEKIRYLTEKVKQMALSNVYERTVKLLNEMAKKEGDIFVINNKPTQDDLAKMVGASREMINKVMHELTKGAYIVVQDNSLRIVRTLPASW